MQIQLAGILLHAVVIPVPGQVCTLAGKPNVTRNVVCFRGMGLQDLLHFVEQGFTEVQYEKCTIISRTGVRLSSPGAALSM